MERFWSKVDKTGEGGCWLWTAALRTAGYGVFWQDGRLHQAHRISYEEKHGPIEEGFNLDHICRVRRCVNPEHLRPTTQVQNLQNQNRLGRSSRSGIRNVHAHPDGWEVQVSLKGVRHYGGLYRTIEEADAAAVALRNRLFTHHTE